MTTKLRLSAALSSMIAGTALAGSPAEPSGTAGPGGSESGLIHTNRAFSPAVHSYPNPAETSRVAQPELRYVSLAYGPSLYSYPRLVPDTVTAFNVHFISNAYGPAIYSYPGLYGQRGNVHILPFLND